MITLRKLESLPETTRGRKLMTLLNEEHEAIYTAGLVRLVRQILGEADSSNGVLADRDRKRLRQRLGIFLGLETADWDIQAPADREGQVVRFPFAVWLDDLRSPFNVGSLVRTAEAYGFEAFLASPFTPGLEHPRARRSAMGADDHLPMVRASLETVQSQWGGRPVFALELGGTPIDRFDFPDEGLVIVGGEELGVGPEALDWADRSYGRVSLPLFGRKASLNVGVAFGILAAAWTSRRSQSARIES